MIRFLWHKIWKNKWLTLCLLIGNILLVGIVTATPLFTSATMQRILQEEMRQVQHSQNTYPAIMHGGYIFNSIAAENQRQMYYHTKYVMWPEVVAEIGIPPLESVQTYTMTAWNIIVYEPREIPNAFRRISLVGPEGFAEHVELLHGRLPSNEMVDGRIIEVLATSRAMHYHNLILDELLVAPNIGDAPNTYFIRVVGIYTLAEGSESYWSIVPINLTADLLVSDVLVYQRFVQNPRFDYRMVANWTQVLDFTAMRAQRVPHYQETIRNIEEQFDEAGGAWNFRVNFYSTMERHLVRTAPLAITLWVLQLPLYVMLALYMYMVSRQILLLDKNDIAVLHSRGASRGQILGLYVMQGLFIAAVSFPIGLGLGVAMCHALGGSNGFLEMVQRTALDVEITRDAILFGIAASIFSFLTMLIPVIKFSKFTIVDHKRGSDKGRKPIWHRYFLDVLFFGLAVYGLYTFHNQQEIMAAAVVETQFVDPLLFINSSLFILGAGLICLRIFPYLVKLVFLAGRNLFPPALYASMLKVIRSAGEEQFIMVFLVFTVSIGIFSAQAARTINLNNDHRILYMGGSDLMFREVWRDNVPLGEDMPQPSMLVYTEPNFNRFIEFDEVESITRVMRRDANLRRGNSVVNNLQLMGIDTRSFGETVWFREDLLPVHINYFLNALAAQPDGVLLSDNFRTQMGYQIGDVVTITEQQRFAQPSSGRFVVVGFFEHWPGVAPVVRSRLATGEIQLTDTNLAVVNLGHIHTNWGVRPYQVWMQTNVDSAEFFHEFIRDNTLLIAEFNDTVSDLVAIRSDPIVQGTNGVLTVSFIMTLLVCFTGLLIYWILSIRSRVLQFGIFRAMGMGMRGIISLLVNEQIFITLTALIIGGIIGEVSARLFVPLIQISYTAADQVIPLLVVMEVRDYVNMYGMLGVMIILCLIVLSVYVSRIKISQALKLGED